MAKIMSKSTLIFQMHLIKCKSAIIVNLWMWVQSWIGAWGHARVSSLYLTSRINTLWGKGLKWERIAGESKSIERSACPRLLSFVSNFIHFIQIKAFDLFVRTDGLDIASVGLENEESCRERPLVHRKRSRCWYNLIIIVIIIITSNRYGLIFLHFMSSLCNRADWWPSESGRRRRDEWIPCESLHLPCVTFKIKTWKSLIARD